MTIGAHEAQARLSELLRSVERGERVTITRHGRPVAVLVSAADHERHRRVDAAAAVAALKEFARGHRRGDFDIRAAIEEGRR